MCRIRSYYFLSELMDLVYHRLSIIKQQRKANRRLLLGLSVEESCCCCISTCHGGDSNKQMPVRLSHSKMLHRVAAKFLNGPLICQLSPWVQNDSLTQPVPWSSLIRFLFFPLHRPCSRRHHSIYIVTTLSSFLRSSFYSESCPVVGHLTLHWKYPYSARLGTLTGHEIWKFNLQSHSSTAVQSCSIVSTLYAVLIRMSVFA